MGLQSRLLAGLAVLVFAAIASTGWLSLEVARSRLDAIAEDRARSMGETAAGLMGSSVGRGSLADEAVRERLREAEGSLGLVGGIEAVRIVDAQRRALDGTTDDDAGLSAALRGGGGFSRRAGEVLSVYAPLRAVGGATVGAVRIRMSVGATLHEAVRGSERLLLALTLVDGGLILLFGALFLRGVIRPMEALSRAAQQVAQGDLEVRPIAGASGEVAVLADAFYAMTVSLREQESSLASSREQLVAQEKLASVGKLAAGVAHEVGNPLTAVLGYVELLLRDEKNPGSRDLLERVRSETGRIHRIVHDLLDYARPEAQATEPVHLGAIVDTAVDLLRPQARFRGVLVERRIPDSLQPASASASRIVQVVLNLLLNAADAMAHLDEGKRVITITGRDESTDGRETTDEGSVAIDFTDSGSGVPVADSSRIFDPFFTTKDPGAGTGLGLAICRSIARAYGGDVMLVESPVLDEKLDPKGDRNTVKRRGATFRLTLPRWRASS